MSAKYISNNFRLLNQENSSKNDNYGLTFDGSSERIEIPFTQLNGATNCTISFWAKINYSVDSEPKYPFTLTSGTDYDIMWNFGANGTSLDVYIGNLNFRLDGSFNNDIDEWNHWVLRFDGSQSSGDRTKIYQNGQQLTSQAGWGTATSIPTASHLIIGGRNLGSTAWYYQFPGSISDISIFDYTLSESQISTLYGSSSLGSGNPMALKPQPVAYYPLGDNSASNPLTQPNVAVEDATVFETDAGFIELEGGNLAPILNGISNFTLSLWYKQDAISNRFVFDIKDGTNRMALQLVNAATNYLYFNSSYNSYSAVDTPINQWNNLVFVFDGSQANADRIKLYINGSQITAATTGTIDSTLGSFGSSTVANLGAASTGGSLYALNGEITNSQIWNASLSSSEITTLYNSGVPLYTGTQPQAANLKAWYKLNNTANWEADSSGNWQIPEATSAYPQSFNFDGSSDYVDTGAASFSSLTEMSVSAWVKPTATGTGAAEAILSTEAASPNRGFYLSLFVGSKFRWQVSTDGSNKDSLDNGAIALNEWTHIVATWNQSTMNLYVNGSLAGTMSTVNATGTFTTTNNMFIGQRTSGAGYFPGNISNVQFFDTVIPATGTDSVETLYNNGSPLTTAIANSNLKLWAKLDNTATFSTNWVVENSAITSNFNKAIDFVSSSTQYIDLTNTGFPTGNAARTMSAWIKSDSTGQNNEQGILRYGTKSTRQLFMMSLAASNGRLRVSTYGDDLTYSTDDLRDDAWHHVALTYDGTSIKGYVDGSYVGVETNTLVNTTANLPAIGNWNNSGFTFNGAISNVLLYTETLTDANILTLYNNGTPQTTPYGSPFGWWKLDNLITGIQDSGSGGNNGTLVNSPLLTSTDVQSGSGISSGMTEQNLVNNNVSALNGESSGMTSANLVTSDLTRAIPYGDGYSFNFDSASSDYINVSANSSLQITGDLTLSCWFKSSDSAIQFMIYLPGGNGTRMWLASNEVRVSQDVGGAYRQVESGGNYNDGIWHSAIGVMNTTSGFMGIYIDGVLKDSRTDATGTRTTANSDNFIGSQINPPTPTYPFNGKLSNVAIWGSALTSTEVLKLYSNGVPQDLSSFTPQPVAWYPLGSNSFWNGSTWTCRDMIGSNDGTGVNIGADGLVGDAPRSEANGTGTNMDVPSNLEGNTKWSSNNSYSVNMSSEARKQDTP